MKVIKTNDELVAARVKQLASWVSTVEQRYESGQTTSSVAEYKKHPSQDIWFFFYDDIFPNMGDIGKQIMDFLLTDYEPTGNPVINTEVLEVVELTEAELSEYDPQDDE